jgi:peptide/nickel transport system permease protein
MWGFGLRAFARLMLGLIGAVLLAAAIAALPSSGLGGIGGLGAQGSHAGIGVVAWLAAWAVHLGAIIHFDFGTSQVTALPAAHELARRLPVTLELVGAGAAVALVLGVPLGLILGAGQHLRAAAPLVQIVAAAPVFCAGLLLLWLADHVLGWHEGRHLGAVLWNAGGHAPGLTQQLRAFALPALTVGAAGAATVQLALRRAAHAAMDAPYRQSLRLMGLSRMEVGFTYLAPRIAAGLLASLGDIVLALISAAAVAEWVFVWPGAAVLFVKSVALADWNVAALVLLVFAAITLAAAFIGTLSARALTPGEAANEIIGEVLS